MKSVDKLRDCTWIGSSKVNEYLDEIEAEIAETEAFCKRVEEAARNNDELDVFGVAYMPLPVDADGVPVRIGDVMEFAYDPPQDQPIFEVSGFGAKGALFYVPRGEIRARKATTASIVRHAKQRTLEDALEELEGLRGYRNSTYEDVVTRAAELADEIRELLEVGE